VLELERKCLKNLFRSLWDEYMYVFADTKRTQLHCPSKTMLVTQTYPDNTSKERTTVMSAMLRNGITGAKLICANDEYFPDAKYHVSSRIVLFDGPRCLGNFDGGEITRLRCSLMAALAIQQFIELEPDDPVGFIGFGKINQYTASILPVLFGTNRIVVRTRSPVNATLSTDIMQIISDNEVQPDLIRACPVLISCTTSLVQETTLEYNQLSGPKLFVAQDTGYLFAPSFRQVTENYADYPLQLAEHFEEEFPWDTSLPIFNSLAHPPIVPTLLPTTVYLHGIGLSDVLIAYELWQRGLSKPLEVPAV